MFSVMRPIFFPSLTDVTFSGWDTLSCCLSGNLDYVEFVAGIRGPGCCPVD